MKRMVFLVVIMGCLGATYAAAADKIEFAAKNGVVVFDHAAHQKRVADCQLCHGATPGKIADFGKDVAHKLCKGCHAGTAAPTTCRGCHK